MANSKNTFDYIIIGAGASGCVIANRLSANSKNKVLLLEAGGDDTGNQDISDIGGFVRLWGTENDWQIKTTPQQGLSEREIVINQGKVLGGSTSINAMMYVRGNRKNFDMWNTLGADGWSYNDVLPYFKKIEKYGQADSEYHGTTGELNIMECPDEPMRSEEFLNAAKEAGYKGSSHDYNSEVQEDDPSLLQFHIDKNLNRESSATAFLHPVMDRSNLTVITGAHVSKVVIENGTATGVVYIKDGLETVVCASAEIVVSAGALASPKILLLSGIGLAEHLREHSITVNADLPGVGQNLQDHIQLPIIFRSTLTLPNTTLLTGNVLFVRTRKGSEVAPPDMQINFTPSMPAPLAPILPDFGGPICIFLAILVQPFSTGYVKLTSADPMANAEVNPNYLHQKADIKALTEAVQIVRKIAGTKAFEKLNAGELAPGSANVEEFIRSQSSTLWHPAGTCKIGQDAMAVVDSRLRVYGIENLRVADASVMPTVTTGNTVAACFMIGERAAEMILQDNA